MFKYWLSMISAVIFSATSQILLKSSANNVYENRLKEYLNPKVVFGYTLMIISTLCVIYAYRGIEYKNGAVIESIGYILIMLLSRLFFKEEITGNKIFGNILILLGVIIFYI